MSNLILKIPELQGIEKSKAEKIKQTFEPMVKMLEDFEGNYNEIIKLAQKEVTNDVTSKARRLRIDIGKVRIETGKLKDKQKEYIKLEDRAIMGVHNIIVWAVKEKEDKLKEIEKHFEIQEQKRLEKLQNDRAEKLRKYVEDAFERDLAKFTEEEWDLYFSARKKTYEDEQEAIKKAEEERLERERKIKLHNERKNQLLDYWQFIDDELKDTDWSEFMGKDFTELLKILKKEKTEYEKEQARLKAKAEKLRKEKELAEKKHKEAEAKAKAEAERKRKEYEAELEAERKERERLARIEAEKLAKLEAELKAKKEAEKKRLAEIEAKKQAELQKGDADKMHDFIIDLQDLKSKYTFKLQKYNKKYTDAKTLIDKIIEHIK